MTGRHSLSTPGGPDRPAADTDAEATATAIAGLRWRLLQHPEALDGPTARRELRKLEELITDLLGHAGPNPGRHRSATGQATSPQISDADGLALKPNPAPPPHQRSSSPYCCDTGSGPETPHGARWHNKPARQSSTPPCTTR